MTTAVNPNVFVARDPACGGYHDLRMACPMNLIAAVKIEQIRHEDGTVDRKIEVVLDCGCRYFLSLELVKRAPRPGDLSHCREAHGPFQSEELA